MKLLHTADIHLDACFASCGMSARVANRRRQSLRDVLQGVLTRAREWPADAVLIAGDLFDLERVTSDTVAFLKSSFEAIRPVRVFITPGNHDPYVPSSPYATESWPENVVIFSEPKWEAYELPESGAVIHGFGFDGYDISTNPFGTLRVPSDGRTHIAVGHGTERGHQPPEGKSYAPFDVAACVSPGLAYLALGHFHGLTEIHGNFSTKVYYPGAPEGHAFDETGAHYYLKVVVENGVVRVTPVASSRVIYTTHAIDCSGFSTAQHLIDVLRQRAKAIELSQVARVTLGGACSRSLTNEIPLVYDTVSTDFEFLDLRDETAPLEDYEALAQDTTSFGAFLRRMNEEIADAPDGRRRRVLERAREVGVAAYRDQRVPILGLDSGGDRA